MSRVLRAAMTETSNAYGAMPARREDLGELAGRLGEVREANLDHHAELIAAAAAAGAELVGLGELFALPYFALEKNPMWLEAAEDALTGPTVTRMRRLAAEHHIAVVSPIYELDRESGRRFNTAVVIDAAGEVIGKYRKNHIPAGTNEVGEFHETFYYERGDGDLGTWPRNIASNPYFPVFDLGNVKLGVAICYDRHFGDVTKALAAGGAELVLSPAVTFGHKSQRMWDLEFEVDAARNGIYIGGSNRRGAEAPWNQPYFGGSHFVGPNGRLAADRPRPELIIADIDLDALGAADPSGWRLGADRRDEIYDAE